MEKVGKSSGFQHFLDDLAEKHRIWAQEEQEKAAQEKAEWESLPETEKQRIITIKKQREKETAIAQEQRRIEWEQRREREQREKQIEEWTERGITPRFYESTWENWIADTPEKKQVFETMKQAWTKNLFVNGKNGTGKTHLAMCLAKDGATYCLLPELFRSVRENMDAEQAVIDKYGTCKLLVLDEVGRQKGTEFERNLFFEIIDKRWNNLLTTTIVGNIGTKEFADLYGAAVLDRLRPVIVNLNWESKRQ